MAVIQGSYNTDALKKINLENVKALGNKYLKTDKNSKYKIFSVLLLLLLIYFLTKLNKFHNP